MAIEDLDLEFEEEEEAKSEAIDIGDDLVFSNAPTEEPSTEPQEAVFTAEEEIYPEAPQQPTKQALSSSDATDPNLRLPQEFLKKQNSQKQQQSKESKPKPAKRNFRRAKPKESVAEVRDISQARKKVAATVEQAKPVTQVKPQAQTVQAPAPEPRQAPAPRPEPVQQISSAPRQTPDVEMFDDVAVEGILASQVQFMQKQVLDLQAQLITELKKNGGGAPDPESMKEMEKKMNQVFNRIVKKVPSLRNEVMMLSKILQEFKGKNK